MTLFNQAHDENRQPRNTQEIVNDSINRVRSFGRNSTWGVAGYAYLGNVDVEPEDVELPYWFVSQANEKGLGQIVGHGELTGSSTELVKEIKAAVENKA